MAISLYDLSVASFLQTLGGVAGFLQRGLDHFRDNNTDPSEIVETRLYGDMLPFRFQSSGNDRLAAGSAATKPPRVRYVVRQVPFRFDEMAQS